RANTGPRDRDGSGCVSRAGSPVAGSAVRRATERRRALAEQRAHRRPRAAPGAASMKLRRVLIKLGVFTLVTALVTVILASQIGNLALFRARYSIEAAFDNATGIASGDPVTL